MSGRNNSEEDQKMEESLEQKKVGEGVRQVEALQKVPSESTILQRIQIVQEGSTEEDEMKQQQR